MPRVPSVPRNNENYSQSDTNLSLRSVRTYHSYQQSNCYDNAGSNHDDDDDDDERHHCSVLNIPRTTRLIYV